MSADTTPGLEAERAAFEEWAAGRDTRRSTANSADYSSAYVQNDWAVWQAARRAPAPAPQGPTDEEIEAMVDAYNWDSYIRQRNARRNFARAVLARWGAPAASREPVARKTDKEES